MVSGVNKAESIDFGWEAVTLYLQAGGKLVESGRWIMWDGGLWQAFLERARGASVYKQFLLQETCR